MGIGLGFCCCESCAIFGDDFNRADDTDLGSDWDEDSGAAEIKDNKLRLTSAGTLVVTTTTKSGDSDYLACQLDIPDNNKTLRIIVDYVDSDSYHFLEIDFRHSGSTSTLQLYKRSGGTNTAVGSSATTTALTTSSSILPRVCLTAAGQFSAHLAGTGGISVQGTTTVHGGSKVGIYLEDATNLDVDGFVWGVHESEDENCDECLALCNGCSGTFTVVIADMADDACSECERLNGTFVLTPVCGCTHHYEWHSADVCDDGPGTSTESNCDAAPVATPRLKLLVSRIATFVTMNLSYQSFGGFDFQWTFAGFVTGADTDCEVAWTQSLTSNVGSTLCDDSGASIDVTFVED